MRAGRTLSRWQKRKSHITDGSSTFMWQLGPNQKQQKKNGSVTSRKALGSVYKESSLKDATTRSVMYTRMNASDIKAIEVVVARPTAGGRK